MIRTRYGKTKTSCSICTSWKEVQEQLHNLSCVAPTLSLLTTFKYNIQLRVSGRLHAERAGRDVCRNGTLNGISPCMYIHVPFIWKEFCRGTRKNFPGKAGSRFAQPRFWLKWDNFYHINIPSRFAAFLLCHAMPCTRKQRRRGLKENAKSGRFGINSHKKHI